MSPDPSLPEYAKAPVEEVAISLTFETIDGLTAAHLGRLWQRYPEFPETEDQPELNLVIEDPTPTPAPDLPRLEVAAFPRVRAWFLSRDGTRLIQVQRNRFGYNWRRGKAGATYPHYPAVMEGFVECLDGFRSYLRESGLPDVKPVQCEITYLNHIRGDRGWPHSQVADVVRVWANLTGGFLPAPEDVRFLARYVIPDKEGGFLGRLAVTLNPALLRGTGEPLLALNLTARGKPLEPTIEGALDFFNIGHEWIVRGFTELTTEAMHRRWERQR